MLLHQRIFRYASPLERILYAISCSCAVASGAALPLMTIVFGSSTSTISGQTSSPGDAQRFKQKIDHLVLYFVYLFVARFVLGYIGTLCACVAAARTTNALRKAFLESLLRQGIPHFDKPGNGSVATQVTTSMHSCSCILWTCTDQPCQMATASTKASPRKSTRA